MKDYFTYTVVLCVSLLCRDVKAGGQFMLEWSSSVWVKLDLEASMHAWVVLQ